MPTNQKIQAFREKVRSDPVWFIEHVLKSSLWPKQRDIVNAVRDSAEVSVRSCHASGKTYTAARIVHWWLASWDDAVVISTAPTFRQVEQILWREIRSSAAGRGLYPPAAVLNTKIQLSDKWFALGLSTDNPDQFQGFHSPHLLVIGDEAPGIGEEIFQAMDGLTATKTLLLGNPTQNTGRFADTFKKQNVAKIQISAFDVPMIPGLITEKDIIKIREYYGEESDVYRVRVLGEFPKSDVDTLISVDDVYKAMQREVTVLPQWEKKMGVDPARFGDDRTIIVIRQMERVLIKEHFSKQDTMQTVGNIIRLAKEYKVLPTNINIDAIGIGAGIVDRLHEQGWDVCGINVALPAKDTEHYLNLRAELYDVARQWIKKASMPQDDDFYELANVKYRFNSSGKLQIESKDDMKKRGLPSPDVADAVVLTLATGAGLINMTASPLAGFWYPEIGI